MSDTANRVQQLLSKQLHVDLDRVTDSARLVDDLGADSLDSIEIILLVEDEFEIHISDDRAECIQTVGCLVQAINELSSSAPDQSPAGRPDMRDLVAQMVEIMDEKNDLIRMHRQGAWLLEASLLLSKAKGEA